MLFRSRGSSRVDMTGATACGDVVMILAGAPEWGQSPMARPSRSARCYSEPWRAPQGDSRGVLLCGAIQSPIPPWPARSAPACGWRSASASVRLASISPFDDRSKRVDGYGSRLRRHPRRAMHTVGNLVAIVRRLQAHRSEWWPEVGRYRLLQTRARRDPSLY